MNVLAFAYTEYWKVNTETSQTNSQKYHSVQSTRDKLHRHFEHANAQTTTLTFTKAWLKSHHCHDPVEWND